jgi:hydrogenase expression/formation protein HypC
MCLAVPALITKIEETMAEADLGGIATRVSILFTPEAKVGDYVVMHAGYAISVLDTEEAEETLRLLRQLAETDAVE